MMTIAAFGDSIARGIGDLGVGNDVPAWPGRLAHRLGQAGHLNLARAGARVEDVITDQLGDYRVPDADVALLSAGGNDLLDRHFEPDRFAQGLTVVLRSLRRSTSVVVIVTLPDHSMAWPLPRRIREGLRRRIVAVNAIIRDLAGSHDHIIDQWTEEWIQAPGMRHPDRVHLSPAGYQALADRTAHGLGLPLVRPPLPIRAAQQGCAWRPSLPSPRDLRRGLRRVPVLARMGT